MPLGAARDRGGTGEVGDQGGGEKRSGGPSMDRGQGTLQDGSQALSSFPFWRSSGAKAAEKHHRAGASRSGQGEEAGESGDWGHQAE